MNKTFFRLPETMTQQARNAFRLILAFVLADLVVIGFVYYQLQQAPSSGLWIAFLIPGILLVFILAGLGLVVLGHHELGIWLTTIFWLLALLSSTWVLAGMGFVMMVTAVIIAAVVGTLALSTRQAGVLVAIASVLGVLTFLADSLLPSERINLAGFQVIVYIIVLVSLIAFGAATFRRFRDYSLRSKVALVGVGSVLVTTLALLAVIIWQSNQYNILAQNQFDQLVDSDLGHITNGVYNMVNAQDELVQQMVNYNLNVARQELNGTGQVSLAPDYVEWVATNQYTQQSAVSYLPKLLVGDNWLGQNADLSVRTPVVDDIENLVGGTATIFQRMDAQGDMLRVATNVQTTDGKRAVGTYIPATMPDGTPNTVISTVMSGKTYRGDAYVVNAWYDAAYAPILDITGQVIGMLYVGVKQQNVQSLRQAILQTQVGKTGYVFVLGSDGNDKGRYIISQQGTRDGENVWDTQDAQGNYVIQTIVDKALTLKPGETGSVRYLWQNPGDPAPRWKVARIAYYAPWHWVIGASTYEDELQTYRGVLQSGQSRMILISGVVGLIIILAVGVISLFMALTITRPIAHLADVAAQVAADNLDVVAKVEQKDEIGSLAVAFNEMTSRLKLTLEGLRRRTLAVQTSVEVSRRLAAVTNPRQLAVDVVEEAQSAFHYYHAHIYFVDDATGDLIMAGGTGEAGAALLARGHKVPKGRGLVGRAAETNMPVLVPDVSQAEGWLPNPLLPDTKSEAAVPISAGKQVFGVLDVQQNVINGLGEEDVELLQSLASQVAISLQNARTFEESRSRADLETLVNTIGQKIQKTGTVEETLQTAIREIGIALGASRVKASIGTARRDDGNGVNQN